MKSQLTSRQVEQKLILEKSEKIVETRYFYFIYLHFRGVEQLAPVLALGRGVLFDTGVERCFSVSTRKNCDFTLSFNV